MNQLRYLLWFYFLAFGCAGPTSPFGAINRLSRGESASEFEKKMGLNVSLDVPFETDRLNQHFQTESVPENSQEQLAKIQFYPDRQLLHRSSNIKMIFQSPKEISDPPNLKLFYNNFDVTDALIANSKVVYSKDRKTLAVEFQRLTLPDDSFQTMKVYFQPTKDLQTVARQYLSPVCGLREESTVRYLDSFAPPAEFLAYVKSAAHDYGINSSLIAGLIAQESGFDPEAVSWAKAIGLTQVATLAEREVAVVHGDWPRHPEISENSVPVVKAKITAGSINLENEWRLDPQRSVLGGVTYLDRVINYWDLPQNKELLTRIAKLDATEKLKVILASYHSGPARVGYAIKLLDSNWISSDTLNEARGYVHRIISYCYHFSKDNLL